VLLTSSSFSAIPWLYDKGRGIIYLIAWRAVVPQARPFPFSSADHFQYAARDGETKQWAGI